MLDRRSALILCIKVAFSLLSASVPHVVPRVPILLPTVADTSNPAEIKAPEVFLVSGFSSIKDSLGALLNFLFGSF